MRLGIVATLLLPLAVAHRSPAADQPPEAKAEPSANAALQYWQAFAVMPTLDKDREKILADWATVPLDAAARKLVESSRMSVEYLRRGARMRHCDWGLDYNDGVGLLLPHLAKARDLARLAALHARLEFERGHRGAGVDDVAAIFVLARHVSEPITISILVSYAIEGIATDALAPELPRLGGSVDDLAARLAALPTGATLPQAILNEKMHMDGWMVRKLREVEAGKPGLWRGLWKTFFEGCEDSEDKKRVLAVDSFEQAVQLLEDLRPVYDQWAQVAALPKREFDVQYPALVKQARAANPLGGLLLHTSANRAVARRYRNEARAALLRAALAVARGGPDKLKGVNDPFGDGPFEYHALDHGFELKSKLLYEGKPVMLMVGRGTKDK